MRSNDAFPSRYIKAADLKGKEPVVTIDRIATEAMQDGVEKYVLYFRDAKDPTRGMVLNKTNWEAIEYLYGDSDDWPGKKIQLHTPLVAFQGKVQPGLRVKAPTTRPVAVAPVGNGNLGASLKRLGDAVPRQYVTEARGNHDSSTTAPAPAEEGLDDEIPF